jgi:hypothetical protein
MIFKNLAPLEEQSGSTRYGNTTTLNIYRGSKEWRKLHDDNIHNLQCSPHFTVARCEKKRNLYKVLKTRREQDNIKADLR